MTINTHPSYDLAIPLLDIYLGKIAIHVYKKICTRMLIAILFIKPKWKQMNYLSIKDNG